MRTGAAVVADTLQALGVSRVFGMPGVQTLTLVDALEQAGIRNTLANSEGSAAFMADGYCRVMGRPGVCLVIPGPGLTNMVTPLAEALLDSSPLVVLVVGIDKDGRSWHIHQIDQLAVMEPVVKRALRVDKAGELSAAVNRAVGIAGQGEPGPVVLEIPRKLLTMRARQARAAGVTKQSISPHQEETISRVAELLLEKRSVGIYAGRGALAASQEILRLAEVLSAPVATTISGKGVIPEDHPLACGFGFGPVGTWAAEQAFAGAELVLALGCKFSEMSTGSWSMELSGDLVHVDQSRAVLDQNYRARISLCMDVQAAVRELLAKIGERRKKQDQELIRQIRVAESKGRQRTSRAAVGAGLDPPRVLQELRRAAPRSTVFVTDCGLHQLWAILELKVFEPMTFLTPADYQAMGFCVPAAIGAAMGRPAGKVVGICGDGGFLITGLDLLTAVREELDLAVVIFNDGALGLIRSLQQRVHGRSTSVELQNPDFEHLCRAVGARYIQIDSTTGLRGGLEQMMDHRGVVLANIRVGYGQWPRYLEGAARASWTRTSTREKLGMMAHRLGRILRG